MARGVPISKFYKSFSGTDTIAFLMFPGINPIVIGSLTTISYSMYRNKVPVINIGRTNINGITRGSRIYAGTMVFTLINKHWLRELQEQASYLSNFPTLKTDELPLFDIMIVSANEYGSACSMFIYGVDFTDEAQTLSIEDLFTENLFKFVAREVSVFDDIVITESDKKPKQEYLVTTGILNNFAINGIPLLTGNLLNPFDIKPLTRTLYLVTNGLKLVGDDVAAVQQLLNLVPDLVPLAITRTFDMSTDAAVREFQTTAGLIVNGIVDNGVYTKLLEYVKNKDVDQFVQIINKSGAFVYQQPSTSSLITKTLPYLSSVEVLNKVVTQTLETFYQVQDGFISLSDVYEYVSNTVSNTFELLQFGDENPQVTLLQHILQDVYENFVPNALGVFDEITESFVKMFQRDYSDTNGLIETGIVDYYTWQVLLDNPNTKELYRYYNNNHVTMSTTKEPGIYNIKDLDYLNNFKINIHNNNPQQVKYSAIAVYGNGQTKTDSKVLLFDDSQEHSINEFVNMFKDDIKYLAPTDVYYIVYPYGDLAYKWHFKVKGGESNG